MAITATDILLKLSTTAGAAGNANTSTPAASLGKYISTTQLSGTALNNLFDNITGAENAGSVTDYRCFFVHNAHATLTLQNPVVWLSGGDPAGGAIVSIAVDSTAASALGSSTAQALTAASETAPGGSITGLTYSTPTTSATGLALTDLAPGQVRAVWVKRAANNSAAVAGETINLAVTGDTAP